jgi:hypothetical protein
MCVRISLGIVLDQEFILSAKTSLWLLSIVVIIQATD